MNQVDDQDNGVPDLEPKRVTLESADLPEILSEIDNLSHVVGEKLSLWLKISTSSVWKQT